MNDLFNYSRRQSAVVPVGNTPLGGNHPIRLQSMVSVSTMETSAAIAQSIQLISAGAEYVRFAVQGEREAKNLGVIRRLLQSKGYSTPLVADIHFHPKAADIAAHEVEKVRINPAYYAQTPEELQQRFTQLLHTCKEHQTALRIGVNHGSLSERIRERYGDTPEGMVASAIEFLDICEKQDFTNVVVSIKASNTPLMVKTVRLLVATMDRKGMNFPLHLGVTEAGDGLDARIKSAIGIGTLLADGIGDTIRVSLTESPEKELPFANALVNYIRKRKNHPHINGVCAPGYDPLAPTRRISQRAGNIGGNQPPVVIFPGQPPVIVCADKGKSFGVPVAGALLVPITFDSLNDETLQNLKNKPATVAILGSEHPNPVGEMRAAFHRLLADNCNIPVILYRHYKETNPELLAMKAAADFGPLLLDGFGDGLMMTNHGRVNLNITRVLFYILQAVRLHMTYNEYISCPGCGRTLYDLTATLARIREATKSQLHLKIAVMGCIVNGPGEMADADYGYVGAARGRINLYKGKQCVQKDIPEAEAVQQLVQLIKASGDWK